MIHLDYRDARPIYSQIVDGFREQIIAGILPEGEKLPSVRELAAGLTINPNTIQRAYRELEAAGWIATVPGKGCFVCGVPAATINSHFFHYCFRQCGTNLYKVVGLRGLEPRTIRL